MIVFKLIYALLPQVLSFIILGFLVIWAFFHSDSSRWVKTFSITVISIMVWISGDVLEQVSKTPVLFDIGSRLLYTGIISVSFSWFMFALLYSGNGKWLKPWKILLTGIIPIISIIIFAFNDLRPLMRTLTSIDTSGMLVVYTVKYGPWFWVHAANSYLLILLGAYLLTRSIVTTSVLIARQKIILVIASLIPWVMNVLYLLGVTGNKDFTTVAFTPLAVLIVFGIQRFRLLSIGPIARGVIFEHMMDPVIVVNTSNKIMDINLPAIKLTSNSKEQIIGQPFATIFPELVFLLQMGNHPDGYRGEIGVPSANPTDFFDAQISIINDRTSDAVGTVVVLRNINDIIKARKALEEANITLENRVNERTIELQNELAANKLAQKALYESDERYSLAIQGANDGIWDWDLSNGTVFYSPRWKAMIGCSDIEIEPTIDAWFNRVHADDQDSLQIEISRHLESKSDHFEHTHRIICKDGSSLWVLCRGLAKQSYDGVAVRMSGSMTDITPQKLYEEQILFDAFHDQLTGLPNRALLMERITHSIERAKRLNEQVFALIFIDLDRFKNINDSLGHNTGDQVLKIVAERLNGVTRSIDTVARLGGDEFIILLDSISGIDEATNVANRIVNSISEAMVISGAELTINASLGFVLFSTQYSSGDEILRDADIAMYQAKKNRHQRYEFFDVKMREKIANRIKLEAEIRHAIQNNEFDMFYQPIINTDYQATNFLEALIRWHHPVRGLVSPAEFIPIAEETGLIIPIGHWVIKSVCEQIAAWKSVLISEKEIVVSINLSAQQLVDPKLCDILKTCMTENSLDSSNLIVEITETALIDESMSIVPTLQKIKAMGVAVHIDDFGTGYSSLAYLHTLPFDALKIDRSFVDDMVSSKDTSGLNIVQTIVSLGKEIGKFVVAEGVETQEQMDILKGMGCSIFQGYLISKPMNPEDAGKFLKNNTE